MQAAEYFLNKDQYDAEFVQHLEKAEETERALSERNVKVYNALLEDLVRIAETPNV